MPYWQNGRQSYFRVPEFPFGTPRRQGDSFPSEGMLPEPDLHKLISENDDKGAIFMKIHLPYNGGVTLIENTFIDRYMPAANGEFVKIYLYLLRCASSGISDLSISGIADVFDHTEADVRRALNYWVKVKLIELNCDEDGSLKDVRLLHPAGIPDKAGSAAAGPEGAAPLNDLLLPGKDPVLPAASASSDEASAESKITEFRPPLSRREREETVWRSDIQRLLFIAEQYYGRPLAKAEEENLVYFLDTLRMSEDLIEFLLEYCITKGHKSARYIEKVAQAWHSKGISSVEQARSEIQLYNKDYFEIFRALGIRSHMPTDAEIRYMDSWLKDLDMSMDVIREACARTVLKTSKAQFSYADSILRSWHESGVHTLADVRRLDELHAEKKASGGSTLPSAASGPSSNRFNNFQSRDCDWDRIGRLVIQSQESGES